MRMFVSSDGVGRMLGHKRGGNGAESKGSRGCSKKKGCTCGKFHEIWRSAIVRTAENAFLKGVRIRCQALKEVDAYLGTFLLSTKKI